MDRRRQPARPARLFVWAVRPRARFRVVSEPLAYRPTVEYQEGESFLADLFSNDYEARVVRYGNTRERVPFFPPKDADVRADDVYLLGEVAGSVEQDVPLVRVPFRPADSAAVRPPVG